MSGIVDQLINGVVKGALSEVLTKTGIRKTRRARRTKSTGSLAGGIVGSVLEAAIKAAVKPKPAKTGQQKTHRRRAQPAEISLGVGRPFWRVMRCRRHAFFPSDGWKSRHDMLFRG